VNGVCDNGINGNGYCLTCVPTYYGPNCDKTCTCVNGVCDYGIYGNGSCLTCAPTYYGANCDKKCFDSNCSIPCQCNGTCTLNQTNVCTNDITIYNQTFSFPDSTQIIFLQGNITIDGSNLTLTSIDIFTSSYLTITNSSILFNSSSFISSGCINVSNTNITIDLSNASNINQLLIFNSSSGCLNVDSLSISFLNQPKCTTLKTEQDSFSVFITFSKQQNCGPSPQKLPLATWELILIIVASVVVLAIITIVIIMLIPSIRKKIFVNQDEVIKIEKKNIRPH